MKDKEKPAVESSQLIDSFEDDSWDFGISQISTQACLWSYVNLLMLVDCHKR